MTYTEQDCLNEIQKIEATKSNIKSAIESKGVGVPDNTPFSDYADKINEIRTPILTNVETGVGENGTYTWTGGEFGADGLASITVEVNVPGGGDSYSYFDGSVDEDGLRAIGWTEDDIKYFKDNCPHYAWEDSEYTVSDENKALGTSIVLPVQSLKDNPNIKYLPSISPNGLSNLSDCKYLVSIPHLPEVFDTWDFSYMFDGCKSLTSIPPINTSQNVNFSSMFSNCESLKSVPSLNTENGTVFTNMFNNCKSLTSIPTLDTSNGTGFSSMFNYCESLKSIPQLNTGNGTGFSGMFYECTNLTSIPPLNTGNGTNFDNMFSGCSNLTSIPSLNTENGTSFGYMFNNCKSLTSIPTLDTSNGTGFSSMFNYCSSLERIEGIDFSSVETGTITPFGTAATTAPTSLSRMIVNGSINTSINFGRIPVLDFESMHSILTAASNTTNTDSKTMTWNNRTIADQEGQLAALKADCESKGWQIKGLSIS